MDLNELISEGLLKQMMSIHPFLVGICMSEEDKKFGLRLHVTGPCEWMVGKNGKVLPWNFRATELPTKTSDFLSFPEK